MRKTYRYKNLSFAVADNEDVNFTLEFVSDGNMGDTIINIPGDDDPEIENAGTVSLGKGKDLRSESTVVFSSLSNPIPEEDTVKIFYKINGEILKEHTNKKSEEKNPIIVLIIKFTEK